MSREQSRRGKTVRSASSVQSKVQHSYTIILMHIDSSVLSEMLHFFKANLHY